MSLWQHQKNGRIKEIFQNFADSVRTSDKVLVNRIQEIRHNFADDSFMNNRISYFRDFFARSSSSWISSRLSSNWSRRFSRSCSFSYNSKYLFSVSMLFWIISASLKAAAFNDNLKTYPSVGKLSDVERWSWVFFLLSPSFLTYLWENDHKQNVKIKNFLSYINEYFHRMCVMGHMW